MISPEHIDGLVPIDMPQIFEDVVDINSYRIYSDETVVRNVCSILGYKYRTTLDNSDGFKETSLNNLTAVVSLKDAIRKVRTAYGGSKTENTAYRTCYPCYVDTTNKETLRFVVIIRPGTDTEKIQEADSLYAPIPCNAAV
jgi:predicted nucleic-acid-binding protein